MGQRKTVKKNGNAKASRKSKVKRNMWDTIKDSTGEDVIPIVKYLKNRKNISEFQIASNIKMEVNTIRNALYRLQTNNLVTYFRKKDRVKGWYISYWSFNHEGIDYVEMAMQRNKINELTERLHREERHKGLFFICPGFCTRVEFDKAAECEFTCPECGKVLQEQDNTKTIETLKAKIKEVEMET